MVNGYWCWGCGSYFESNICDIKKELEIIGIIDTDPNKWGEQSFGYVICGPERINDYERILITTTSIDSVLKNIISLEKRVEDISFWDNYFKKNISLSDVYSKKVFSLDGEECFLKEKFAKTNRGVYVDVGCHHPFRFSNTQWAYMRGWRGLNIDPNKEAIRLFDLFRPDDINLNCGISDKDGYMDYYSYEESAFNSFVGNRDRASEQKLESIIQVKTRRLDEIFKQYNVNEISFIDIDVEGMERKVIESIDFRQVSIDTILVEQLPLEHGDYTVLDVMRTDIYDILSQEGYAFTNKYNRTVIYEKKCSV